MPKVAKFLPAATHNRLMIGWWSIASDGSKLLYLHTLPRTWFDAILGWFAFKLISSRRWRQFFVLSSRFGPVQTNSNWSHWENEHVLVLTPFLALRGFFNGRRNAGDNFASNRRHWPRLQTLISSPKFNRNRINCTPFDSSRPALYFHMQQYGNLARFDGNWCYRLRCGESDICDSLCRARGMERPISRVAFTGENDGNLCGFRRRPTGRLLQIQGPATAGN